MRSKVFIDAVMFQGQRLDTSLIDSVLLMSLPGKEDHGAEPKLDPGLELRVTCVSSSDVFLGIWDLSQGPASLLDLMIWLSRFYSTS